jgi:hypothetical protein
MNKFGTENCNSLVNDAGKSGLELAAEHGRQVIVHNILRTMNRKLTR